MAFLEWSEKYSVGIRAIDAQHRQLVELLNGLHDEMLAGKGSQVIGRILDALLDYSNSHFVDEESLMAEYQYPTLAQHREEHTQLTEQVIEFQERMRKGEIVLSVPVLQFLKDWLTHHILQTDMMYSPFLRARGVA